ncbi:MAG: recombinase family protein [Clostridia bacterium]|nr:recombinase family protein [Clostridia bacterium]
MENCVGIKPKVRVIPAKSRQVLMGRGNGNGETSKLRVAAYARVSTDHEEQESSYEAQVEHFTRYIEGHEDWEMAGIFADPGISGKNIKRPEFQRMIAECENGRIDKIITKSVSRFARNTLDCVQSVRKLKEQGIGVYFEKENLDTLQESSEFVLTIMASLAEEESRSISNNIRWSIKKKFENGQVVMSTASFLGYTMDKDGKLQIVPEQAVTVKRIYGEFLDGYSLSEIANGLMRDGVLSPKGKTTWHPTTIKSILQNEKYKGDCHLQKTYLPDFLSPRRIKNEGQADSYYVEDSHAGIVSKEMFEMVQQEFKNRNELRSSYQTGRGKYSGKYAFSGMITCGECGETYRRHQQYNRYKTYYIWVCKRHENTGKQNCSAKPLKEEAIKQAFVRALNGLLKERDKILDRLTNAIVGEITDDCESDTKEIDESIQIAQDKIVQALRQYQFGQIGFEDYERTAKELKREIDALNLKRAEILDEQSKVQLAEYRIDAVKRLLQDGTMLEEFDKSMFKSLVKRMKVIHGNELEIEFECGIKVREIVK